MAVRPGQPEQGCYVMCKRCFWVYTDASLGSLKPISPMTPKFHVNLNLNVPVTLGDHEVDRLTLPKNVLFFPRGLAVAHTRDRLRRDYRERMHG